MLDQRDKSALTFASLNGAASCERWMRIWCLSKEGWESEHADHGKLADQSEHSNDRTEMSESYQVLTSPPRKNIKNCRGHTSLDLKSIQAFISPRKSKQIQTTRKMKFRMRSKLVPIDLSPWSEINASAGRSDQVLEEQLVPDCNWPTSYSQQSFCRYSNL